MRLQSLCKNRDTTPTADFYSYRPEYTLHANDATKTDPGLGLAEGGTVIVVETVDYSDPKQDDEVTWRQFDSVKKAIEYLEKNGDHRASAYSGWVAGPLNSNGMADWIVLNTDKVKPEVTDDGKVNESGYEVTSIVDSDPGASTQNYVRVILNKTVSADDTVTMKVYSAAKGSDTFGRIGVETPIVGTDRQAVRLALPSTIYQATAGTYNMYVILTVNGVEQAPSEIFEVIISNS